MSEGERKLKPVTGTVKMHERQIYLAVTITHRLSDDTRGTVTIMSSCANGSEPSRVRKNWSEVLQIVKP